MQKGLGILKMRVFNISNEIHYDVDGFICYRKDQHILLVLTVSKGKKIVDENYAFFYLFEKTIRRIFLTPLP